MDTDSLHALIRKAETNYVTGSTKLGDHVDFSMHDTVERITAYIHSKHTSGDKDSLGRDKPFFNIVTSAVNIWYRATDIDRKDIIIRPDKSSNVVSAFLATVVLQDWMKRERFGVFLNQWGHTLAQYGSAIVKFVEKDGTLIPSVIPWNRIIVDPVSFDSLPTVEKFYLTPAQLRKNSMYDQEAVEALIEASKVSRKTLQGNQVDNRNEFIELYEVHGELEEELLTDKEKDPEKPDKFVQQMHVISFVQNKKGKYDDFTLYKGREKKHPYMITHLVEQDGRTLSIGAVEYLFDAQWMQNHSIKAMKDTLDLSSKLIFQTTDAQFADRNVLTSLETGDILVYSNTTSPLTQVNNSKPDITAIQNFASQWKVLSQELTSTPDALRGSTLPSGTPYALGTMLAQNASSLFEIMVENKILAIEDMMREFIIPHIKTKLNNKEEIAAILSDYDIKKIDAMYIPKEAVRRYNQYAKESILSGSIPSPFNQVQAEAQVKSELAPLGNHRFFSPEDVNWSEVLKDIEWELEIGGSNEMGDKQAILTTLASLMKDIATNPAVLQDPNAKMIFNKILSYSGIVSPVEISTTEATPSPTPAPSPGGNAGQLPTPANQ